MIQALERAAGAVGGMASLAARIGVSPSAPSMWRARGSVPAVHCLSIERATNGQVTRADLRPDDYWLIWPDLPAPDGRPCIDVVDRQEVRDAA